jgi:hypothetical protein
MFVVGTGCRLIIAWDFSGFYAEAILQRPLPNVPDIGVKLFNEANYVSPLTADVKLDVVSVHVAISENDHVHEVVYKKRKKPLGQGWSPEQLP